MARLLHSGKGNENSRNNFIFSTYIVLFFSIISSQWMNLFFTKSSGLQNSLSRNLVELSWTEDETLTLGWIS